MISNKTFKIADDEILTGIFNMDLYKTYLKSFFDSLSAEEKERALRYQFEKDQEHFTIAHGILRELLSRLVVLPPDQISIDITHEGKPFLHPQHGSNVQFNLSHSHGYLLIALTKQSEIGADIEYVREDRAITDIVERFFSEQEYLKFRQLPDEKKCRAFYFGWTCKEAFVKAIGRGVAECFSQFSVNVDSEKAPALLSVNANMTTEKNWYFQSVSSNTAYQTMICWSGKSKRIRLIDAVF